MMPSEHTKLTTKGNWLKKCLVSLPGIHQLWRHCPDGHVTSSRMLSKGAVMLARIVLHLLDVYMILALEVAPAQSKVLLEV